MLTIAYLALSVIGCGYIVVSAFLGHLMDFGGHEGHGDAGHGHGESSYGVDGSGHSAISATDVAGASFHFPFFSPLALSTLGASVGGWGLVAQFGLKVSDLASLTIAVPAALATAYGVTYLAWSLVASSRASSAIRLEDIVGSQGEVITPIPAHGLGEVAALVGGQRFTAPAREMGGRALDRGTSVTVVRMTGSTLIVAADRP